MVNYPRNYVPIAYGDLVSHAVEKFAKDYGLDYDLWYHDEPIWLIRQELPGKQLLVKRLQVAVFDTLQGPTIKVIPDAYIMPSKDKWDEKKPVSAKQRFELSVDKSVSSLIQAKSTAETESLLYEMLKEAWVNTSQFVAELNVS